MILEKMKPIIAELFSVEEETITLETTFESLGADSLDLVELGMAVEEEFDLELSEEQIDEIKTVGDVVTIVKDLL